MSYVFYPGCSLESTGSEYYASTKALTMALGVAMPELKDWTCCGSTAAHQSNPLLALALPAKNLAAAKGQTVAVSCASCYSRLRAANAEISADAGTRARVADALGGDYDGSTPVKHLLEILRDDIGAATLATKVVKPLAGLKVAAYYGCLLVRPPETTGFDDPENPRSLDVLMEAAGAEAIDWPHKTECCGASYSITQVGIVQKLSREILSMAKAAGADCIVTACPLCQLNLDMRQRETEQRFGESYGLPVLYFTQLLGLALGVSPDALALKSLIVDPLPLLEGKGLLRAVVAAGK